jgi:hypothetical protein
VTRDNNGNNNNNNNNNLITLLSICLLENFYLPQCVGGIRFGQGKDSSYPPKIKGRVLALIVDKLVLLTHNLPKTAAEKITKYENLALEIKNFWKLNNVLCTLQSS